MKAELFLDAKALLGEGPVYHEEDGLLYWVDIDGRKIHKTNIVTAQDSVIETPSRPGVIRFSKNDVLYAGLEDGFYRYENGKFVMDTPLPAKERMRSNDGGCDPRGRMWLGTMELSTKQDAASLYVIEKGNLREVLPKATISNGLCYSPDLKYMYYIDTPTGWLWRFDYDVETGNISNRTPWIDYREEPGNFDGMTIDSQGQLWIAHCGGGLVTAWDPISKTKQGEIPIPAKSVTCCTFGGPDYDQLFITTATFGRAESPAGGLFVCRDTGAKGLPCLRYQD